MKTTRTMLLTALALIAVALTGCGQEGATTSLPVEAPPEAPDQTILWVAEAASAGDMARVWDAMPESYQRDVTRLAQQFGYAVDVESWEKSFRVMDKTATLMASKKEFILGHPLMQQQDATRIEELNAEWDSMASALQTLSRSDISTVGGLRSLNVRSFLDTTGRDLAAYGDRLRSLTPMQGLDQSWSLAATEVEVLEESSESARVSIKLPEDDKREEIELTRVDGRWVPAEMAEGWDERVASMQTELEEMVAGKRPSFPPEAKTMLPVLEGALDELLATQTQEEFNTILEQRLGALMMQQMMNAQGGAGVQS
jgi:hypothetical protein